MNENILKYLEDTTMTWETDLLKKYIALPLEERAEMYKQIWEQDKIKGSEVPEMLILDYENNNPYPIQEMPQEFLLEMEKKYGPPMKELEAFTEGMEQEEQEEDMEM